VNFKHLNNIFSVSSDSFGQVALEVFRYQFQHNGVYRHWCTLMKADPGNVSDITQVPFLPISFFKTHRIGCGNFEAGAVFESSGTTQSIASRHYVKDTTVYETSFMKAFTAAYGEPADYCILALLPSYLEKGQSSLVYMVDKLVKLSGHPQSGFYLYDHAQLHTVLSNLERSGKKTILFGVTYALLDFAEEFPMKLKHTIIIETGGMKGRKKELTRAEVHMLLQNGLGTHAVHSEYGMTELLSQAYSKQDGLFQSPAWMKILVRDESDPLQVRERGQGIINVADLANVYSCAFIATEDAGKVHEGGSFEVMGRVDNSDIRGCSLMAV